MAKRASPRSDWLAWCLLVIGLAGSVCVLSHEPAPATPDVMPPKNLLGTPGDWLAARLFHWLGAGVYLLLACWFLVVLILLMPKKRRKWLKRLAGWTILLPWSAVTAELVDRDMLGDFRVDGGLLGGFLRENLERHFPPAGIGLLLGAWLVVGLLLGLDHLMRGVGRQCWSLACGLGRGCRWLLSRNPQPVTKAKKKLPQLDDVEVVEEDDDSGVLDIPIVRPEPVKLPEQVKDAAQVPIVRLVPPVANAPGSPGAGGSPDLPISDEERFQNYELPPLTMLEDSRPFPFEEHDQKLREVAQLLEKTFKDFELNVRVVGINTGPVITQYEIALETGLRLNKVTNLSDDLALNLKVPAVRIVAPIPGKNTVGIEVPNEHRADVRLKEVILTATKKVAQAKIPLFLGKDTEGRALVYDLAEMPHLLIAGRTGTGKSVCMNAIILSILMTRRPDEVKMVMIDPKMLEMSEYGKIPHLMHPVVKDMRKAEAILAWAVDKMEERYDLLSRARVRNLAGYNDLGKEEILRRVQPEADEFERIPERMPYIVIFVDEMNDLMMTMKREVEGHIIRLAQKSRAAGIHLVVATQKPTVDVITGLIKSNLPARICFQVSSRSDSRVVLDEMGAEKLLGKGDMLFLQPGTSTILRAQGTYASDNEISQVVKHLETEQPCFAPELMQLKPSGEGGSLEKMRARDDLYEQAVEIIVREGRGSVSLLQRAMGIGYGRSARLIDFMAEDGIVGAYNGSNAREVLLTPEQWQAMRERGKETADV